MRRIGDHNNQQGQTLIEVLIAITLVVMVLVTLVAALTLGVRNNHFAKDQVLSKARAREAIEWIRAFRQQVGWDALYTMVLNDAPPVQYCLQTIPTSVDDAYALSNTPSCLNRFISTTTFVRTLTLTPVGTDRIDATVKVQWKDGNLTHESQSTVTLTKWL